MANINLNHIHRGRQTINKYTVSQLYRRLKCRTMFSASYAVIE